MARDTKLKAALDRFQGVDHKLERQKQLRKKADKRKRQRSEKEDDEVGALEGTIEGAEEAFAKLQQQLGAGDDDTADLERSEQETSDIESSDEGDDEEEEDEDGGVTLQIFDDESDSDSEEDSAEQDELEKATGRPQAAEGNEEDDDEEDEEEDIALSDLESLDEEEKGDMIPYQRLTINNTAALTRSLKSFSLPSSVPFAAVQAVTSAEPVTIADVEDDLNRELAFYKQSLDAVKEARAKLKKEGAPFSRPADYFAEMVKSEEQMGKVKQKMVDEAARKKASQDARRQRDLKKFGKAVQIAKLQERDKAKKATLDKINVLKRKRQGGAELTTGENDMFDVALEDADETAKKDRVARQAAGPNRKRHKKDEKFGFGGKKRFAKSNDAKSAADMKGFSVKKMKGGKQRPGKSRRAKMT